MREYDSNIKGQGGSARDQGSAEDWPAPGKKLRTLREEQGISQSDIAQALHLTVNYVNALEQDQYDKMPGKVFVKGYFRNYAELLGADPDEIVRWYEYYDRAQAAGHVQPVQPTVRQVKHQDQGRYLMLGGGLVIVLFVGLSWWFTDRNAVRETAEASYVAEQAVSENRAAEDTAAALVAPSDTPSEETEVLTVVPAEEQEGEQEQGAENIPEPVDSPEVAGTPETVSSDEEYQASALEEASAVEAEATEPQMPVVETEETTDGRIINLTRAGEDELSIRLSGNSWVEVSGADDARLFGDLLGQGDELRIQAQAPFNILVGDAHQVGISFNREKVDIGPRIRADNTARVILQP